MIIEEQSTQTTRQVIANFREPATDEDRKRNRDFFKQILAELDGRRSSEEKHLWQLAPIAITQFFENGLTGFSLTWRDDINPHSAVEIISAQEYYGEPYEGAVAIIHGHPINHFTSPNHHQEAEDFINKHHFTQQEIDDFLKARKSAPPTAHAKNYWARSLSKLISDFLMSKDSESVIQDIIYRTETEVVKRTAEEFVHFSQAIPKKRCAIGA